MNLQPPIIGQWFYNPADNDYFEVVAVDELAGTIEIQYSGGELGEYDIENWYQLGLNHATAPEDANAGFEADFIDWGDDISSTQPPDWRNPLAVIEPESFQGFDDF